MIYGLHKQVMSLAYSYCVENLWQTDHIPLIWGAWDAYCHFEGKNKNLLACLFFLFLFLKACGLKIEKVFLNTFESLHSTYYGLNYAFSNACSFWYFSFFPSWPAFECSFVNRKGLGGQNRTKKVILNVIISGI